MVQHCQLQDGAVVLLNQSESIHFMGQVQMRVYSGSVEVFGHTFRESNDKIPLYATNSCYLAIEAGECPPISQLKNDTIAVIVLMPLNDKYTAEIFEPELPLAKYSQLSYISGFYPVAEYTPELVSSFVATQDYISIAGELQERPPGVTLVCGGVNSVPIFLSNSLLKNCTEVAFLDCDIGQTEFTPPGLVSLNIVDRPLIGPPFTHVSQPVSCCFIGDTTPAQNPGFYFDMLCHIFNNFRNNYSHLPLIINTCGWVQDMGHDLLVQFLSFAQPDFIVQCKSFVSKHHFPLSEIDLSTLNNTRVYSCITPIVDQQKKFDYRSAITRSYFSPIDSIESQLPYCIPWNKLNIAIVGTSVPPSQILYALNGTLVGLCVDHTPYIAAHTSTQSGDYPNMLLLNHPPICECVGIGIIRAIDPHQKVFYIITPVPLEKLKHVNTILRGSTELHTKATINHNVKTSAPYMTLDYLQSNKRVTK